MAERIILTITLLLILMSKGVTVYAESVSPPDSGNDNIPTTEISVPDNTETVEPPEIEGNEYTLAKLLVNEELHHSEIVKMLGSIVKLQVGIIVCILLFAGAFVGFTVMKHMPEG